MTRAHDLEGLLARALAPVEPPADLADRLEERLVTMAGHAADELDAFQASAMRDPRNWVRPVVAASVATGAGSALVLLGVRRNARRRAAGLRGRLPFRAR